jgi:hypothetical protein
MTQAFSFGTYIAATKLERMGPLGNFRNLHETAEIRGRFPTQLEAGCDAAGRVAHHRRGRFNSHFPWRPNHTIVSSVLAALLLVASGAAQAKIIDARSPSLNDVNAAIASAADGDTVMVPAGTAAWTSTLTITKGIQLIGKTTTDPVAGTAVDNTIIQDNVTRGTQSSAIIRVTSVSGKSYRVSGLSFQPFATTPGINGMIVLAGNSHSVRLDHCHFKPGLAQGVYVAVTGAIYGVADHNILEFTKIAESFFIRMGNWPNPDGTDGIHGDGAFAAPTAFGSEKFFFIEDNYFIKRVTYELNGATDDFSGARWVFRHNHCYDIELQTHGTEGARFRGGRAREIYNNDFHNLRVHPVGGIRSGVTIIHDNTYYGAKPQFGLALQAYRSFFKWKSQTLPKGWGGATGDNPWDVNDTEGNGTNVPGHSPFLFASGTAGSGSSKTSIVDTSKNWKPDQWKGFTAKRVSDSQVAYITANTNNTLTVECYNDSGGGAVWTAGDQYQIHKCLIALDQPGRGQGDLIVRDPPANSQTGTQAWPHQLLEPTYAWNDLYTGGVANRIQAARTLLENRDFYNNTPMPGYKPYIYPHPLTSGLLPPANLTIVH